jgi:chromosome segregation ATPase
METVNEESVDTLASLEQRVQHAVEVLTSLRAENAQLGEKLSAVTGERDRALAELSETRQRLADSETHLSKVSQDLDGLRAERKQVKTRIEKLLGQMDLLSAT